MKIDRHTKTEADLFFRRFERRMVKKYGGEIAFIQYLRFNFIAKKRRMREIFKQVEEGIIHRIDVLNHEDAIPHMLPIVKGIQDRIRLYLWLRKLRAYEKGDIVQLTKFDKGFVKRHIVKKPKK